MKQVKVPKLTRIHFAYIANILDGLDNEEKPYVRYNKEELANIFAINLARTNVNFNREKFMCAAVHGNRPVKKAKKRSKANGKASVAIQV